MQMNKMVASLEEKVNSYKQVALVNRTTFLNTVPRSQASEAEQLASANLNMFRRKQQELEEAEERARAKEQEWAKCKGEKE